MPEKSVNRCRMILANHFKYLHDCRSKDGHCSIETRINKFMQNKPNPKKYKKRHKFQLPSTNLSTSIAPGKCLLCQEEITSIHQEDKCQKKYKKSYILCPICDVQVVGSTIYKHVQIHKSSTPELRSKYSHTEQSHCDKISGQILLFIDAAIKHHKFEDLSQIWLDSLTNENKGNSVHIALSNLKKHCVQAVLETNHYCLSILLYTYLLKDHIISCECPNCPALIIGSIPLQ